MQNLIRAKKCSLRECLGQLSTCVNMRRGEPKKLFSRDAALIVVLGKKIYSKHSMENGVFFVVKLKAYARKFE